jgi:hypothetical protein
MVERFKKDKWNEVTRINIIRINNRISKTKVQVFYWFNGKHIHGQVFGHIHFIETGSVILSSATIQHLGSEPTMEIVKFNPFSRFYIQFNLGIRRAATGKDIRPIVIIPPNIVFFD